jgi:hypothetical protein
MGITDRTRRLLLLTVLLGGCAIDTEPIAATGFDAGFSGAENGDAEPAGAPLAYAGCDVDLTCTAECDDDLDCPDGDDRAEPPDLAGLRAAMMADGAVPPITLDAGAEAWFALPVGAGTMHIEISDLAAPVTLAVYDAADEAWALMGRSTTQAVVEMAMPAEAAPVLRVVAREAVSGLDLSMTTR